jgi:type IV pilus assembly protein PilE
MKKMQLLVKVKPPTGFTLIEVMIVVAIIAVLAGIALPSYKDYVLRGQLVDAQNLLSAGRANMERYYQDNRTYAAVGTTATPPCAATQGLFTLSCSVVPTATTYTLSAAGSGVVAAFVYTTNQVDAKTTVITSGPAGWNSSTTCWITKRGQAC